MIAAENHVRLNIGPAYIGVLTISASTLLVPPNGKEPQ
jgi:hypothetical protein